MGVLEDIRRNLERNRLASQYPSAGPRPQHEFLGTNQITLTTTPQLIAPFNPFRDAILITNPSFTADIIVGNFSVTPTSGKRILPRDSLTIPTTAEVWGVLDTGTLLVTIIETWTETP